MKRLSKLTLLLTALFTLSLASVPVYAKDGPVSGSGDASEGGTTAASATTETETGDTTSGTPETHHGKSQNSVETANTASTDAKQKQCDRRQKTVETILSHIATRGQKQIDLFGTIATRVENFATTNNKQPSNYDSLVAAVNTAHDNAVAAVADIQTKSTSVNLNCNSPTGSKGVAESFKAELKSEISALQAYRTAVKNLIVGVKSSGTGGSN